MWHSALGPVNPVLFFCHWTWMRKNMERLGRLDSFWILLEILIPSFHVKISSFHVCFMKVFLLTMLTQDCMDCESCEDHPITFAKPVFINPFHPLWLSVWLESNNEHRNLTNSWDLPWVNVTLILRSIQTTRQVQIPHHRENCWTITIHHWPLLPINSSFALITPSTPIG